MDCEKCGIDKEVYNELVMERDAQAEQIQALKKHLGSAVCPNFGKQGYTDYCKWCNDRDELLKKERKT